jgi:hypothetical protein
MSVDTTGTSNNFFVVLSEVVERRNRAHVDTAISGCANDLDQLMRLQIPGHPQGDVMLRALLCLIGVSTVFSAPAASPRCVQRPVEKSVIEICLVPGAAFQHDLYTLKIDKVLVFALVDDYAEKVSLEHSIPDGETIELPLSKQGDKVVKISGGCVPESKDGAEVARVCSFVWGHHQIVKDVRFEFN